MLTRIAPVVLAIFLMVVPTAPALAQDSTPLDTDALKLSSSGSSSAAGWAWVSSYMDKWVVTVLLTGVEPGSGHSNHIHTGSCESQGGIVYPLADLTANSDGVATATTLVSPQMAMMDGSFYVNVHTGVIGRDANAGAGIACGNMKAMMMMGM